MEIKKSLNGKELTLEISGRMDTATAPELEVIITGECTGLEKLIFELKDLEYISSAGLRVFIKAQKMMNDQGEMIIRGANETVKEIFDITGLLSIFTVEQ